jgi:hypothetical protein
MDRVAPGQVFSENLGLHCQFSCHRLLHIHHLLSGAEAVGQIVADVPSGPSLTPLQEIKTKVDKGLEGGDSDLPEGPVSAFFLND